MQNMLSGKIALPQLPSRLVISLMIIAVTTVPLLAIDFDEPWENRLVALILVLMFASVELAEQRLYGDKVPPRIGHLFLVLRIVLAASTIYINDSPPNMLLFPLIPFSAYFDLGSRASNILALIYIPISFAIVGNTALIFSERGPIADWLIQFLILFFLLIFARAWQRDKEHQSYIEQLLADLQISHRELQVYAAQVAELVAVEERNRLARDIHDSLGHYLAGVNIQLERARVFHARDPQQSLLAIQEAKQAAEEALRDVRRSVAGLRETDPSFSLRHSLATLLNNLASDSLQVDFQFSGDESGYNRMALLTLYRAVQEGLTNIQKHANATQVKLEVELGEHQARLCLSDNGRGFDPNRQPPAATNGSGYGLQGIRERIGLVRGQMTLTSTRQQGTTLLITVPKNLLKLTGKDE
jgi:signal transduction histidine kinase